MFTTFAKIKSIWKGTPAWTLRYNNQCYSAPLGERRQWWSSHYLNWTIRLQSVLEQSGLSAVLKVEEGELGWDMHGRRQDTERTEDTLFSVGRHVTHVCPVCLKGWKLSLFGASCRPGGGPQQLSAARVYENISSCWTEVLLPWGRMSSGVYPCFVNTWQDEVIVCFSWKIWKGLLVRGFRLRPWINVPSSGQTL